MNLKPVRTVLIGAGGHARVVLSILRDNSNLVVAGFVAPPGSSGLGDLVRLGDDDDLASLRQVGIEAAFVAVGDNRRRWELFNRARQLGFEMVNAVHPSTSIDRSVRMGSGIAIMAGAVVNCDSVIGDAAIVNTCASVDHDCEIGEASHLAPGAHLSGYVKIGARSLVGVGAAVGRGLPITIGEDAVVGTGAAAVKDIPAGSTVVGVPARELKQVSAERSALARFRVVAGYERTPARPEPINAELMPLAAVVFRGNESRYVNECLDTRWISSVGPFVDRFERDFADFCQVPYAISCANGTVALHLALLGLDIGPGDEVIVPSLTYVATANAVRYCGATPVFVDSNRDDWNLDPDDIARKITPRTRAIIAVHLYGRPAAMDRINELARENRLKVIEDAAEAHGALYNGRPVGSLGDLATFSFYGNKIITTGEGGMVTTKDPILAARIRQLKGQGQDPERRYWFPVVGYNYRMTNIEAALGCAQLEKVDEYLRERDAIEAWYRSELDGHPGVRLGPIRSHERTVCWVLSVCLETPRWDDRDEVMTVMRKLGIDTRPFFYPVHTLPPYRGETGQGECANAEWLGARGLSLPTWVGMTRDDVRAACAVLKEALESVRQVGELSHA
jgi:perosamine synthetase